MRTSFRVAIGRERNASEVVGEKQAPHMGMEEPEAA